MVFDIEDEFYQYTNAVDYVYLLKRMLRPALKKMGKWSRMR
ncbi:MAG: hypothetical protein P4L47_09705 [Mucilaginibacter sp.]|nr:hypothetical protein [Mucilaginibacter sp.]